MGVVSAVFRFSAVVVGTNGFRTFKVSIPAAREDGFSTAVWSPVLRYIAVLWSEWGGGTKLVS